MLLVHRGVTGASRCYWCIAVLLVHRGVTGASRCFWCIAVLLVHRSVTGASRCYWCIVVLLVHHGVNLVNIFSVYLFIRDYQKHMPTCVETADSINKVSYVIFQVTILYL